MMSICNHII